MELFPFEAMTKMGEPLRYKIWQDSGHPGVDRDHGRLGSLVEQPPHWDGSIFGQTSGRKASGADNSGQDGPRSGVDISGSFEYHPSMRASNGAVNGVKQPWPFLSMREKRKEKREASRKKRDRVGKKRLPELVTCLVLVVVVFFFFNLYKKSNFILKLSQI